MKKFMSFILTFIMLMAFPLSANAQRLYLYETFDGDEEIKTYKLTSKADTVAEIAQDSVTGNKYVYLERTTNLNDCFVDFPFGQCADNIVIEADVTINKIGSHGMMFYIKDENNFINSPSTTLGNIHAKHGIKLGSSYKAVTEGETLKLSYVINLATDTYDVYNKGTVVQEDCYLGADFKEITLLRFYLGNSASGAGSVSIDNVKFYEGKEIRDVTNETVNPIRDDVFTKDVVALRKLKGTTAVQGYSGKIFYNDLKKNAEATPYNIDDETYLCISDIKNILNCDVVTLDNEITVNESYKFTLDNFYCINGDEKYLLSYEPKMVDGQIYLPVQTVAEIIGKYVTNDLRGLIVINDTETEYTDATLKEMNNYMFHKRYSASQIKEMFETKKQQHPRLLITKDDFDRIRNDTSETMTAWKESERVIPYAKWLLSQNPVTYKFEGVRLLNVSKEVVRRVMTLGFAYQIAETEEEKKQYLDRAVLELDTVCNFDDWNAYVHFLDAAEMCFAVAIGYDWLYYDLTDTQKLAYETKLKEYALTPARNIYYDNINRTESYFWRNSEINWNGVCNGGVAAAAMAIMETDTDFCSDIISKALRSLEYSLYEVGPDGSWKEGIGYMNYYISYLTRFLSTSYNTLGTHFGMFDFKNMDKVLYYYTGISSSAGTNNFHDSSVDGYIPASAHYFSNVYGNPDFSYLRIDRVENGPYIVGGSNSISVGDIIWCKNFDKEREISLKKDLHYRDIDVVSMREGYNENAMFTSFHGGTFEGSHDHYDAGTFVYDVLGERWVMDLGSDNYDIGTKETKYRTRAEGHNTVVINPSLKAGQDTDGIAPVTKFVSGDMEALSELDLSTYYKDTVNSFKRGYFVGDNRRSLTVYDEIDLKEKSTVYWFMHTDATVASSGNNEFTLIKNGKSVNVGFYVSDENAVVGVMDAQPLSTSPVVEGQNENEGIKKFYVKSDISGNLQIIMKISPADEGITVSPEAKKIYELDVAETQNEFSQSENKGLYGREEADGSLLAEKLKLNVLEKNLPEESRVRISFYQAFNDSNSDNAVIAYGRKDGKCESELLGKILTFTKYGEIKLFDKTVKESYGKFIADKWYKVDLYINYGNVADGITTADLYIDNTKICENEALFQNSRIDAIINLEFDNCYVDDYAVYYVYSQNISEVSPSFGIEDYDKFLLSRKGIYIYEAENAEISDAVLSGDGIASYTESSDGDYIIVKTNDGENIYVPVYTVGKMLYENEAETQKHSFENMFGEIFTVKGRITANGTAKLFAGSDLLFETEKDANFALTFFANKKICEVYVNGELLCEKSYNDINFIEAVNGKLKNVFVYTGGITNDMRITDISVSHRRGTVTGTFSAGGIRKTEGEFMIAFYKDNKLVHIYSEPVSVSGTETSYTIKQAYSGFDEARVFYMDLSTLKPHTKSGAYIK